MFDRAILASQKVIRLSRVNLKIHGLWPKQRIVSLLIAGAILATGFVPICGAQQDRAPHLRQHGTATQLIVDGKPFLVLAGELGNSTSSSLE